MSFLLFLIHAFVFHPLVYNYIDQITAVVLLHSIQQAVTSPHTLAHVTNPKPDYSACT